MDDLIIDGEMKEFVKELMNRYPESQIVLDKRKDLAGEYLYLVGLMIKKEYRRTGIATKIIKDIFQYADENNYRVRAWACNIFGTDLRTWIPFLEEMGFQRVDDENNLIYYPKSSS
jgi:GNAT superfamily N-acetyltransferase